VRGEEDLPRRKPRARVAPRQHHERSGGRDTLRAPRHPGRRLAHRKDADRPRAGDGARDGRLGQGPDNGRLRIHACEGRAVEAGENLARALHRNETSKAERDSAAGPPPAV
jgi:hypothetical protein